MELPESIRETLQIWTEEGPDYLYENEPNSIRELTQFLDGRSLFVPELYRRTNYQPIMELRTGDSILVPRLTSWSRNPLMPDWKYEGIPSVKLVLRNTTVKGLNVSDISLYHGEGEVILSPGKLVVKSRFGDILLVDFLQDGTRLQ